MSSPLAPGHLVPWGGRDHLGQDLLVTLGACALPH